MPTFLFLTFSHDITLNLLPQLPINFQRKYQFFLKHEMNENSFGLHIFSSLTATTLINGRKTCFYSFPCANSIFALLHPRNCFKFDKNTDQTWT